MSYFYGVGKNYKYSGYIYLRIYHFRYYVYEAKAGLNSITLKNKGRRMIRFDDGTKIEYNFAYEQYSGTFMGTVKVEVINCD